MVSYELAKKLKDAGFPIRKMPVGYDDEQHNVYWVDGFYFFAPTIEELIEACGDGFRQLHKWDYGEWGAFSESNFGNSPDGIEATGKTPSEAVANLWLALNEKVSTLD